MVGGIVAEGGAGAGGVDGGAGGEGAGESVDAAVGVAGELVIGEEAGGGFDGLGVGEGSVRLCGGEGTDEESDTRAREITLVHGDFLPTQGQRLTRVL